MTKTDTRIAVIETEVKYLKKSFDSIIPKINEMHETFIRGEGKIKVLNKEVFGDNSNGLKHDVADLKTTAAKASGVVLFMKWIVGVLGIANLVTIFKVWLEK